MKTRWRRAFVWCATGVTTAALGALDASCRDPTEVTVSISTTEPCAKFQGVAITVGPDVTTTETNFNDHFVNATSTSCDAATGLVGTLVLTPGNTTGSVLVAGGVQKPDGTFQDPSQCGGGTEVTGEGGVLTDPNSTYCIIARRTFAFAEHTPLTLPIRLDTSCIGRDCDPGSTCYQGSCVSDNVVCSGSACGLSQEIGQNPGENDASGITDANGNPAQGDASIDARADASPSSDASATDSSIDASSADAGVPLCPNVTTFADGGTTATCNFATGAQCTSFATCCTCQCTVAPASFLICGTGAEDFCSGPCTSSVAAPPPPPPAP